MRHDFPGLICYRSSWTLCPLRPVSPGPLRPQSQQDARVYHGRGRTLMRLRGHNLRYSRSLRGRGIAGLVLSSKSSSQFPITLEQWLTACECRPGRSRHARELKGLLLGIPWEHGLVRGHIVITGVETIAQSSMRNALLGMVFAIVEQESCVSTVARDRS